jgi:hypothetical protein
LSPFPLNVRAFRAFRGKKKAVALAFRRYQSFIRSISAVAVAVAVTIRAIRAIRGGKKPFVVAVVVAFRRCRRQLPVANCQLPRRYPLPPKDLAVLVNIHKGFL